MKILTWIKNNSLLLLLILIGAFIRFYKLDFQSAWGDELFTMINSSSEKSSGEIFEILKADVHPPLYYYIVHFFYLIFGDSSLIARIVSVLFGIAGMFSVYYLSKELLNKKVGIIAVALLVFNYFHIYYSQEARMYSMLFFTTTISFLFLIKFIKKPTLKSAIVHSIFASLMINTHFFALFTLFAQYLILLYFVIKPYETTSNKILKYSFISGIITVILYIPALIIFFQASGRTSFWIAIPERDVYTVMFKEFFGFSETAIFISLIAMLFFFLKLFQRKEIEKFKLNPEKEKQVFTFFILFIWILITLIIPLIISFINLPMIVSRYFINIVPALLILIAAGIYYIKNNLVKLTIISIFLLFSFTDLVIVNGYFKRIFKTQYREVSEYVMQKHTNEDEILSSFEYYFSYFLKKEDKHEVKKVNLNEHANSLLSLPKEKLKSFWYVDINNTPDLPTENTKVILDSLFVVDDNITLLDCYAKHYHVKSTYKPKIDLSKFKPFKERNGNDVNFSVEIFSEEDKKIEVSGWIYLNAQEATNSKIYLLLIKDNVEIILNNENIHRGDVTSYFKSKYDISNSGFKTTILKNNFEKGSYKLAIYIVDDKNKKESFVLTDKNFIVSE